MAMATFSSETLNPNPVAYLPTIDIGEMTFKNPSLGLCSVLEHLPGRSEARGPMSSTTKSKNKT